MKLRTVVIIAVLVLAAYKFVPQAAKSLDSSLGKATGSDEASEPVRDLSRSDLAVVHGRVESAETDVVVIRCTTSEEFRVNRTAEVASRMDLKAYGPLMESSGDRLTQATWRPGTTASGVVRLEGYPHEATLKKGAGMYVIAAPLGSERFTMRYKVRATESATPTQRGSWMFDGHTGGLDKKAEKGRR
jgi:hypothetical protein